MMGQAALQQARVTGSREGDQSGTTVTIGRVEVQQLRNLLDELDRRLTEQAAGCYQESTSRGIPESPPQLDRHQYGTTSTAGTSAVETHTRSPGHAVVANATHSSKMRGGPETPRLMENSTPQNSEVDEHFGHFTWGVVGPESKNVFGDSMDFDMTVLWIAAWYRRDSEGRKKLLEELVTNSKIKQIIETHGGQQWVQSIGQALDRVMEMGGTEADHACTLREITELLAEWNRRDGVLRGPQGEDLLDAFADSGMASINSVISLLFGKTIKGGTLFTRDSSADSIWALLNLLRYWTGVGREEWIAPHLRTVRMKSGAFWAFYKSNQQVVVSK